jgi:RNA polymerase sigma-70 factor (ECF subfamily)
VYDDYFGFVWRNLRQVGVAEHDVDDAVQDVFVVVHRKLPAFEPRASIKTWLFSIVLRVARDHRRSARRKERSGARAGVAPDPESLASGPATDPYERSKVAEAARVLEEMLDHLDDDKRAVFVLAELEQMSVPDIALILEVKPNTVSARLRAARQLFEQAVSRHQARDAWRGP